MRFFIPVVAAVAFFAAQPAAAQLTIQLASVPATTPSGAAVYVAGTFNSWNPADAASQLARQADGSYTITLPASVRGAVEFKFTRGDWGSVEATAGGGDVGNRSYTVPATGAATYSGSIAGWHDIVSWPAAGSTASASVSLLNTAFAMPQLGRTRRIWLYLPPGYASSTRAYPVLYMQDGQNLFDSQTSFAGEWQVDETLDRLQQQGDAGCIVVGIDNGGDQRLNEYSPWVNPQYGGGQGDEYVAFLASTLKPYIDAHYRTLSDRLHTGIGGSSMGGLISLYAALQRPDVFGRAAVFSPSLWFSPSLQTWAATRQPLRPDPRVYIVSGGLEDGAATPGSASPTVQNQRQLLRTLAGNGFRVGSGAAGTEVDSLVQADGQHAEWFWRREFPAAYQWLFAESSALATAAPARTATLDVFPNPGTPANLLTVRLPGSTAPVELFDLTGRLLRRATLLNGQATLDTAPLAAGLYVVRVGGQARAWVKGQ